MGLFVVVYQNDIICVLEEFHYSSVFGLHSCIRTTQKIFQCGNYCPTILQYAHELDKLFYSFKIGGGISNRQELP